jgi:hypothetical protein
MFFHSDVPPSFFETGYHITFCLSSKFHQGLMVFYGIGCNLRPERGMGGEEFLKIFLNRGNFFILD